MNENIATLWEAVADAVGGRAAVVAGEVVRTWSEFDHRAACLAGYLSSRGVAAGSKVAIDLYNSIEYLETMFATLKLRAVPVNVNYRYREAELAYLLDNSGADAIVYHQALAERVAAVVAGRPDLRAVLMVRDPPPAGGVSRPAAGGGGGADEGGDDYETVLAAAAPVPRQPRSGDDLFILYTGGTTGLPKGTLWRQSALFDVISGAYAAEGFDKPTAVEGVAAVAAGLAGSSRRRVSLPASPLMHATGMFGAMGTLVIGGEVVLLTSRSFRPDEVWELVGRRRVTALSIVGDAFARPLVDALAAADAAGRPYDLSSLETISSVGVTLSAEAKAALLDHGDFTLTDMVASSEGGPYAMAVSRRGDRLSTARFVLAPNARLVDEDGRDIGAGSGQVGVLASAGPTPLGYLGDDEKTAATFRDFDGVRYAVPGDQAMLEADGTLVLLGRQSGVINTGGEKVFAEEVEQVLVSHPAVTDALVVGVPDPRWGKRIVALVAIEVDAVNPVVVTEAELVDHVGRSLADYKRPRQVMFVPEIRRTAVGKADRQWAERTAAAATGGAVVGGAVVGGAGAGGAVSDGAPQSSALLDTRQ